MVGFGFRLTRPFCLEPKAFNSHNWQFYIGNSMKTNFMTNKFMVLLLAILTPLCVLLAVLYFLNKGMLLTPAAPTPRTLVATTQRKSVFAELLKPIYTDAVNLQIPALNMNLPLDEVGVLADGSLQTPSTWSRGGWYKDGSRPGESGNMIINAHYDDNYGRPAAFWLLKNLKVNDKVYVQDSFGKTYEYRVTTTEYVGIEDPDRSKIFDDPKDNKAIVTLITCGGVWLPGEHTYSKRLVVQGELIQ
jgi:LPXTG-site transpeptidase (sortase) family protein